MPDLIDLGSTFADDSSHHVVRNKNLLRERLAWESAPHWLCGLTMRSRLLRCVALRLGLMRTSAGVAALTRAAIVEGTALLGIGLGLNRHLWSTVLRSRRSMRRLCIVPLIGVWVTILATGWLGYVGDNLHAARHNASRTAAASSIS